jgi:predicted Zn-dependent protease with MMP-like domain
MLYLAEIHDFCTTEGLDFADQIRITYLHELGHHLGLDEKELEIRGLA